MVAEVEENEERRVCVHTPDQDYAPEGSCHTCLPLRPNRCPSDPRCTHKGSCLSRSVFLWRLKIKDVLTI